MLRTALARITTSYVSGFGVALVLAALGYALAAYAEADDAPGGVLAGMVLFAAGVAIGGMTLMRKRGRPTR